MEVQWSDWKSEDPALQKYDIFADSLKNVPAGEFSQPFTPPGGRRSSRMLPFDTDHSGSLEAEGSATSLRASQDVKGLVQLFKEHHRFKNVKFDNPSVNMPLEDLEVQIRSGKMSPWTSLEEPATLWANERVSNLEDAARGEFTELLKKPQDQHSFRSGMRSLRGAESHNHRVSGSRSTRPRPNQIPPRDSGLPLNNRLERNIRRYAPPPLPTSPPKTADGDGKAQKRDVLGKGSHSRESRSLKSKQNTSNTATPGSGRGESERRLDESQRTSLPEEEEAQEVEEVGGNHNEDPLDLEECLEQQVSNAEKDDSKILAEMHRFKELLISLPPRLRVVGQSCYDLVIAGTFSWHQAANQLQALREGNENVPLSEMKGPSFRFQSAGQRRRNQTSGLSQENSATKASPRDIVINRRGMIVSTDHSNQRTTKKSNFISERFEPQDSLSSTTHDSIPDSSDPAQLSNARLKIGEEDMMVRVGSGMDLETALSSFENVPEVAGASQHLSGPTASEVLLHCHAEHRPNTLNRLRPSGDHPPTSSLHNGDNPEDEVSSLWCPAEALPREYSLQAGGEGGKVEGMEPQQQVGDEVATSSTTNVESSTELSGGHDLRPHDRGPSPSPARPPRSQAGQAKLNPGYPRLLPTFSSHTNHPSLSFPPPAEGRVLHQPPRHHSPPRTGVTLSITPPSPTNNNDPSNPWHNTSAVSCMSPPASAPSPQGHTPVFRPPPNPVVRKRVEAVDGVDAKKRMDIQGEVRVSVRMTMPTSVSQELTKGISVQLTSRTGEEKRAGARHQQQEEEEEEAGRAGGRGDTSVASEAKERMTQEASQANVTNQDLEKHSAVEISPCDHLSEAPSPDASDERVLSPIDQQQMEFQRCFDSQSGKDNEEQNDDAELPLPTSRYLPPSSTRQQMEQELGKYQRQDTIDKVGELRENIGSKKVELKKVTKEIVSLLKNIGIQESADAVKVQSDLGVHFEEGEEGYVEPDHLDLHLGSEGSVLYRNTYQFSEDTEDETRWDLCFPDLFSHHKKKKKRKDVSEPLDDDDAKEEYMHYGPLGPYKKAAVTTRVSASGRRAHVQGRADGKNISLETPLNNLTRSTLDYMHSRAVAASFTPSVHDILKEEMSHSSELGALGDRQAVSPEPSGNIPGIHRSPPALAATPEDPNEGQESVRTDRGCSQGSQRVERGASQGSTRGGHPSSPLPGKPPLSPSLLSPGSRFPPSLGSSAPAQMLPPSSDPVNIHNHRQHLHYPGGGKTIPVTGNFPNSMPLFNSALSADHLNTHAMSHVHAGSKSLRSSPSPQYHHTSTSEMSGHNHAATPTSHLLSFSFPTTTATTTTLASRESSRGEATMVPPPGQPKHPTAFHSESSLQTPPPQPPAQRAMQYRRPPQTAPVKIGAETLSAEGVPSLRHILHRLSPRGMSAREVELALFGRCRAALALPPSSSQSTTGTAGGGGGGAGGGGQILLAAHYHKQQTQHKGGTKSMSSKTKAKKPPGSAAPASPPRPIPLSYAMAYTFGSQNNVNTSSLVSRSHDFTTFPKIRKNQQL